MWYVRCGRQWTMPGRGTTLAGPALALCLGLSACAPTPPTPTVAPTTAPKPAATAVSSPPAPPARRPRRQSRRRRVGDLWRQLLQPALLVVEPDQHRQRCQSEGRLDLPHRRHERWHLVR